MTFLNVIFLNSFGFLYEQTEFRDLSPNEVESGQTKPFRAALRLFFVFCFFTFFQLYSTITCSTLTINDIAIKTNCNDTLNANSERQLAS